MEDKGSAKGRAPLAMLPHCMTGVQQCTKSLVSSMLAIFSFYETSDEKYSKWQRQPRDDEECYEERGMSNERWRRKIKK